MNSRKFYFILSSCLAVFLFITGVVILGYLGVIDDSNNFLGEILKPFKTEKEPVNILVLGGDKVAKNTDTIILVNYNPSTAKINMLSIPRDTRVQVKGSSVPKINSAFPIGGEKLAVDTVSNLFGVKIKYYVYIDTSAFRKIIDVLGGIDINVLADMDYDDPLQNLHIHLKKGLQHMDGSKAEQYMRFRQPSRYTGEIKKFYDGSDLKRIDAQQNFIKEVIRQKANVYYLTKLNSIAGIIYKNLQTNIKLDEALKLSQNISKIKPENVSMYKLPGGDSQSNGGWYFVHDKAKSDEIIKQYFTSTSGFVNNINDTEEKKNNSKPETNTIPKKSAAPPPAKKNETPKVDVTKNNPSNNESSNAGNTQPGP